MDLLSHSSRADHDLALEIQDEPGNLTVDNEDMNNLAFLHTDDTVDDMELSTHVADLGFLASDDTEPTLFDLDVTEQSGDLANIAFLDLDSPEHEQDIGKATLFTTAAAFQAEEEDVSTDMDELAARMVEMATQAEIHDEAMNKELENMGLESMSLTEEEADRLSLQLMEFARLGGLNQFAMVIDSDVEDGENFDEDEQPPALDLSREEPLPASESSGSQDNYVEPDPKPAPIPKASVGPVRPHMMPPGA